MQETPLNLSMMPELTNTPAQVAETKEKSRLDRSGVVRACVCVYNIKEDQHCEYIQLERT